MSPTSLIQPHSEQPHSFLDPPEMSSLADSTNHRPAYWVAGLHHQMASPKRESKQVLSGILYLIIEWVNIHIKGVCFWTYHHCNAIFLKPCFVISDITNSDHCCGTISLQVLEVVKWGKNFFWSHNTQADITEGNKHAGNILILLRLSL